MKKLILTIMCAAAVYGLSAQQPQVPPQGQQPAQGQNGQPRPRRMMEPEVMEPVYDFQSIKWGVHDPVMIKQGDTYYMFNTGNGVAVSSSKDLMNWKHEKPVFAELPNWVLSELPNARNNMWAPDIIFHEGQYHLFYAVSAFAKNTSVIGHATNVTLDPASPNFKWVDCGMIINSVPNRDMWNAIDPNVVIDENGTPWMDFGSFWNGIMMVKLKSDLSGVAKPEEWYTLSRRTRTTEDDTDPGDGAVEAPFIFKKGDWYYLFVSFDYCCRGAKSDYKVAVGRSKTASHGYVDKDGKPLEKGGGTIVVQGDGKRWAGIGHSAAYTFDGKDYFIAHGYDLEANGQSRLIVREMKWDSEGWPIIEI